MSDNPVVSSFLGGNEKYSTAHKPPPTMVQFQEMLKQSGTKWSVIITCADPRTAPESFMPFEGLPPAVIRNAGGRAMDAMRTLHLLNALTPLGLVIVVHHTDCGASHVTDQEVRQNIKNTASSASSEILEAMQFGAFTDFEGSVRDDVKLIKDDPLFAGNGAEVVGMLYNLETGKLKIVENY